MKTKYKAMIRVNPSKRAILAMAVALMAPALVGSVRGAAAPVASGPKTHTLFMGVDISLEHDDAFHRVRDVSGTSFVLTSKKGPVLIPMSRLAGKVKAKVDNSLKLTSQSATVGGLVAARGYTPQTDPRMERMKEAMAVNVALHDEASLALGKYSAAQIRVPGFVPDPTMQGAEAVQQGLNDLHQQTVNSALAGHFAADQVANASFNQGSFFRQQAENDLLQEMYDALDIRFEVSSETPLNNPHLLLIARIREPNAPPSMARNWMYAKSMNPIGREPVKVEVLQGGFPRGYELEEVQVHLYNRGEEVATNVSPKRVELTREEAFEYVKMEYLSSHKAATLPAVPAMGKLPPDLHQRLSGGQLAQTYYVKVSKDGLAAEAFTDEACSQKVSDPYIDSVVKSIRFKPALQKGKPVDAVAPLKLGELL